MAERNSPPTPAALATGITGPTEPYPPFVARRERRLLLIAALFVLAGAGIVVRTVPVLGLRGPVSLILAWALSFAAAHVSLNRRLPHRDPYLLPIVALLAGWGLLAVARLAPNFLPRQATWVMLSTVAMLLAAQAGRDLRWLYRYRYTWLLAGLLLLAATLVLGVNPAGAGPRLWLGVGGTYFQPSETLKLLLVVYLASYLAERRELLVETGVRIGRIRLPSPAYLGPLLVMFGLVVLLLAAQQDLGAAMLLFFTFLAMLYLATGQWGYVVAGLLLFGLAGGVGTVGSERVAARIAIWLSPWPDAAGRAFKIVQSLIAFGEGGLVGDGLGLGRPTYIPAVHTDFVFAAVAEEFGLLGTVALLALYGLLLERGFRAALRAPRPFERFLAAGLTAGIGIQAWIIMAANVGLVPIAGVALPFLSYGGSSLLASFVAVGLLLRISADRAPGRRGSDLSPSLRVLAGALGLGLIVLALACGYWSIARAGWLTAREDNPRRVEYERRIVRGEILDRNGTVLAGVEVDAAGYVTRTYPEPAAAPLLNRAVQGVYPPGAALETVVLAEALGRGLVSLYTPAPNLTETVEINGVALGCREEPSPVGEWMVGAFRLACPGPFAALGEQLGEEGLREAILRWRLGEGLGERLALETVPEMIPPEPTIPPGARPTPPPDFYLPLQDPAREAIGQGAFTVSPLDMALVAATLANDGVKPVPRRVLEVEDPTGVWHPVEPRRMPRPILSPDLAHRVLSAWEPLTPKVAGHLGTAVAGKGGETHAWFLGVAPAGNPRYAVAVLLEHAAAPQDAERAGRLILEAAVERSP